MKLIALFIVLLIGAGAAIYTEQFKIDIMYLSPLLIVPVVLFIVKSIHISTLRSKNSEFVYQ